MYHYGDNEKLKLTPQKINTDLKRRVGQDHVNPTLACMMLVTLGVVIMLSLFWGFGHKLPAAVQIGVTALVFLATAVFFARWFKRSASRYRAWVKDGKYHVVKGTLSSMSLHGSQGPYWFLRTPRVPFDNALYFGSFEPYYAEPTELTRITEGDEYYLVIFDEEPNRPRVIYRVDTYDWRG